MTPAQVFSCEFCEIFKNTLFTEHLRATVSDYTFTERKTSTFGTKILRINSSQIMVLIKKSREIPYQIIQKKIQIQTRQNFFSFGPWLDTLKLEKNPKFQVLGSSGTLLFQPFRIGPLDQKMTATMRKWGLLYVSWFQFLREVFTQ